LLVIADEATELVAELSGKDAITSDDRAPVVVEVGPSSVAVVSDRTDDGVTTGGAPVVEQALTALHVDMSVRPIPQVPDRREDTAAFSAIIVDDPPGFTPEQRRALAAFVDSGGVLLVALGRRAASAPLGANFEPLLVNAVAWDSSGTANVDASSGASSFGEAASSFVDLAARGRAKLAEQDVSAFDAELKWSDGAPLIGRKARGRGAVWVTTLPFAVDTSDFSLRPGFLSLLDAFVTDARERAALHRSDVGTPWTFPSAKALEVLGPGGPVSVTREGGVSRVVPTSAGGYKVTVDGVHDARVAAPLASEFDLRPRKLAPTIASSSQGGGTAKLDVSWMFALAVLLLVAAELVIRAVSLVRVKRGTEDAEKVAS
jgi:hypothetical protein